MDTWGPEKRRWLTKTYWAASSQLSLSWRRLMREFGRTLGLYKLTKLEEPTIKVSRCCSGAILEMEPVHGRCAVCGEVCEEVELE